MFNDIFVFSFHIHTHPDPKPLSVRITNICTVRETNLKHAAQKANLTARTAILLDEVNNVFVISTEKVCFNEPPRRVLVPVGALYLCDYLFPGEAPAEALLSVRELLDLQITESDVVCDVETPAGKYNGLFYSMITQ